MVARSFKRVFLIGLAFTGGRSSKRASVSSGVGRSGRASQTDSVRFAHPTGLVRVMRT